MVRGQRELLVSGDGGGDELDGSTREHGPRHVRGRQSRGRSIRGEHCALQRRRRGRTKRLRLLSGPMLTAWAVRGLRGRPVPVRPRLLHGQLLREMRPGNIVLGPWYLQQPRAVRVHSPMAWPRMLDRTVAVTVTLSLSVSVRDPDPIAVALAITFANSHPNPEPLKVT